MASIELMIPNTAIRTAIREDKLHLIYSMIQTGQGVSGMNTMNQSLAKLVQKKLISRDEALAKSPDIYELESILEKNGVWKR